MNNSQEAGDISFSVYNRVLTNTPNHPLSALDGTYETGWKSSRNLTKVLNHLDFIKEKLSIAEELGLDKHSDNYDEKYLILMQHMSKNISTEMAIDKICSISKIKKTDAVKLLRKYATISHAEFHPTDLCNSRCKGCTYGHDLDSTRPKPLHFPFKHIKDITDYNLKSMVIVGGGEPTLYSESGHDFDDLIKEIRRCMPNVKLSLKTNGTFLPKGDWAKEFEYVRVSIDAATPETYKKYRGIDMFDKAIANYLEYLKMNVKYVGASFLFNKDNIHESVEIARMLRNKVLQKCPENIKKVNIQYRPLRRDPKDFKNPLSLAVTQEQIDVESKKLSKVLAEDKEFSKFLSEQTNITAIIGGNRHVRHDFSRCLYSQIFHIFRANGEISPCFVRVLEPDFSLGSITQDTLESVALNSLCLASARKRYCDSDGCRQCHVNYVIEKGLRGELVPSKSQDVRNDPMF
ncbi:MAG: radical SAM protein [archaeon]